MKKVKKLDKGGFTMVELIVIIAIIAILSAILIPAVFNQIKKSKTARLENELQSLKTAVLQYYADVGKWVKNNNIKFLYVDSGEKGWDGPYTEKNLKATEEENPFGGEYEVGKKDGKFSIKATKVKKDVAEKVDNDMDNGDGGSKGNIRYSGTTIWYIVEQ